MGAYSRLGVYSRVGAYSTNYGITGIYCPEQQG